VQVAKLITEVAPWPVDPYSICRLVAIQMGEPDYMEMLQEAVGKDAGGGTLPLDKYVDNWPEVVIPGDSPVPPPPSQSCANGTSIKHIGWVESPFLLSPLHLDLSERAPPPFLFPAILHWSTFY